MNHTKPAIVHLIQTLGIGGCEQQLLRVLPLIPEFQHIIITLKTPGSLASEFSKRGIIVQALHQKGLLDIGSYRALLVQLRAQKPVLVVTYLFHADLIGRLILQSRISCPVVPFLRSTYNDKRYWPARMFERCTKNMVPMYLANSQSIQAFYKDQLHVAPDRITVIPNGIDTQQYKNLHIEKSEFLSALGVSNDDVILTCVAAHFYTHKGIAYLLDAFDILFAKNHRLHLLLVGDGAERPALERQAQSSAARRNITFLGSRSDVAAILHCTDVFVLPTFFEGMSNAVLEAMASGNAIVTTNIPENTSLFESALFVPPRDSRALAEALQRFIDSPSLRAEYGERAQREVVARYDLAVAARSLSTFFQSNTGLTKPT